MYSTTAFSPDFVFGTHFMNGLTSSGPFFDFLWILQRQQLLCPLYLLSVRMSSRPMGWSRMGARNGEVCPYGSPGEVILSCRRKFIRAKQRAKWASPQGTPSVCMPHFVVYWAQIHLTQPTTSHSFEPNIPQSGTHICLKVIFKHAPVHIGRFIMLCELGRKSCGEIGRAHV